MPRNPTGPAIPVVDIGGFDAGGAGVRRAIGAQVAQAVETIGFFTITGHGVPADLMEGMRDKLAAFFDLPAAEKRKAINPRHNLNRGYVGPGEQNVAPTGDGLVLPDLREAIPFGRVELPDDPYYRAADAGYAYEPNIWPEGVPGFQETVTRYYRALERLNVLILRIFATALSLPEDYFRDKFDRHASVLRGMNYFDQTDAPLPGQLRCAPHTDYGTHTFLQIENAPGGLQVLDKTDRWIDVDPAPGTFVVNIGDLMMNWTNDRWVSNPHRVVNPPRGLIGARRQSIAFFVQPNYDARIECIETCRRPGEPPRHEPVLAWEYRRDKLSQTALKPAVP